MKRVLERLRPDLLIVLVIEALKGNVK